MAFKVTPKWDGRGSSEDDQGVQTLKRQWTVETDSDTAGEVAVINAVVAFDASAALFAQHPDWAWAIAIKRTAEPHGGPRVWLVNIEYSSKSSPAQGDGSGGSSNPTSPSDKTSSLTQADQRPPNIKVKRKEVTKPLEKDVVSGGRVVNTLGDPFDPPIEVMRSHHVITFTFFRLPANLNWPARSLFMDTLNDAAFLILGRNYPAFSLRCIEYSVDSVWETGAAGLALFFQLTVEMEYDPDTWKLSILNTGRRKMVGGSLGDPGNPPRLVNIVDDNGQPISEPVPLDALGQPVVPGGAYHYVDVDGYLPKNWATILA